MMRMTVCLAALLAAAAPVWAEGHNATDALVPTELVRDPSADLVVAVVNGTPITLGEMIVVRSRLPARYNSLAPDVLFSGILDQLVQQQLLADTLDAIPPRVAYALTNEERSLKAGEVVEALTYTALTVDAIEEAYEARFDGVEPTLEFNASHILVETEAEALELIRQLEENDINFGLLAREHSIGPSSVNGGELGWFGPGRMVAPFEAAVKELEVGEVSPPVQTQFGWHIIILNDLRDEVRPSLEDLRGEIEAELQARALTTRIEELTEVSNIDRIEAGLIDLESLTNTDLLNE